MMNSDQRAAFLLARSQGLGGSDAATKKLNGHQRKDPTIKQPRTIWMWGEKKIKNRYELRGDHAVIFLRRPRRKEPDLECLIDIPDLDLIADSNVRWCATSWQKGAQTLCQRNVSA